MVRARRNPFRPGPGFARRRTQMKIADTQASMDTGRRGLRDPGERSDQGASAPFAGGVPTPR